MFEAVLISEIELLSHFFSEAAVVMSYMENSANSLKVTMNFKQTFTKTKPAPTLAYYASRGPSSSFPDILKPLVLP
jgi:hypothetical protein